jgi:hypothetical protein
MMSGFGVICMVLSSLSSCITDISEDLEEQKVPAINSEVSTPEAGLQRRRVSDL